MTVQNFRLILAALLCAAATVACSQDGGAPQAGTAGQAQPNGALPAAREAAPAPQAQAAPSGVGGVGAAPSAAQNLAAPPQQQAADLPRQDNELLPRALPSTAGRETPAPRRAAAEELSARERTLAKREADLAARERRLKRHERAPLPGAPDSQPMDSQPRYADREPAEAQAGGAIGGEAANRAGAPAPEAAAQSAPPSGDEEAPRAESFTVPAGTPLDIEFGKTVASNTSSVGDTFRARVVSAVRQDGIVVIPAGAEVLGIVTDAAGVRGLGGQAKLGLKFTDLVLPSGSAIPIQATLVQQGRDQTGRTAATIGGSTAGGALLGRILSGRGSHTKGSVLGALIGAAAGTAIASRHAGEEVVIPEGSVVRLALTDPVQVRVRH